MTGLPSPLPAAATTTTSPTVVCGNRPPNPLPSGQTILINSSGECILNVPQTISRGANLRVEPGKRFRVNGNLVVQ